MPAQKPTPKTNLDKALKSFEKKLAAKFASKEELQEGLQAIEKKLSKLASKVEVQKATQALEEKLVAQLASKEELKEGLRALEEKLVAQLASKEEVQAFRMEFLQFKDEATQKADERFDIIMQTLDKMYGKLETLSSDKAAAEHTFQRHENRLDNHEHRLDTLEIKSGVKTES